MNDPLFFLLHLPHHGLGQGASKGGPPGFAIPSTTSSAHRQESSGPPIASPTIGPATIVSGPEPIVAYTDRLLNPHAGGEMTYECSN